MCKLWHEIPHNPVHIEHTKTTMHHINICPVCDKSFAFQSGRKQHKTVHSSSQLHQCFSGSCSKDFKWPQDLVHHVQRHMHGNWKYDNCDKTFVEKRLLKRHAYKPKDTYHYHCNTCYFQSKWLTPFKWHLKLHA